MTLDSLPDLDTSGLSLVKTLSTALTCWPYRNMALRDGARTSTWWWACESRRGRSGRGSGRGSGLSVVRGRLRGLSWGNRPHFGADQPRRPQPRRSMRWADVYVCMLADGVALRDRCPQGPAAPRAEIACRASGVTIARARPRCRVGRPEGPLTRRSMRWADVYVCMLA